MGMIKRIKWDEKSSPANEIIHYDHIKGLSGLGEFLITWKQWKQYPSYTLTLNGDYIGDYLVFDDAQIAAQDHLDNVIMGCLDAEGEANEKD